MLNKTKNNIWHLYKWLIINERKIIFLIGIHLFLHFILLLPYINLITIIITPLIYLIDWIFILILFKPSKELIIKIAFIIFLFGIPFGFVSVRSMREILGEVSFLLIGTYILISFKDMAKGNL